MKILDRIFEPIFQMVCGWFPPDERKVYEVLSVENAERRGFSRLWLANAKSESDALQTLLQHGKSGSLDGVLYVVVRNASREELNSAEGMPYSVFFKASSR